jgi:hypothetical protein
MKKSIAIINTSWQLVNVIEAIHHNKCTDNYLIVGQFNLFPDRIKQLRQILKDPFIKNNFKKIYFLPSFFHAKSPLRFIDYILGYIKLFFIFIFVKKLDFCFSGVYTDLYQRPANFLASSFNKSIELWIIDEGLRVLTDAVNRNNLLSNKLLLLRQKKNSWIKNLLDAIKRQWHPPILHFFSLYDIPVENKDILIKNTLAYWKNNNPYKHKFNPNAIVIVGQPLAELKIISLEAYKKYISKMISEGGTNAIYYFPHPMETYYKDWLPSEILTVNSIFPTELLLIGAHIKSITGFNSTVLYNAVILGLCNEIKSYWCNLSDYLIKPDSETTGRIIKSFEEANIEVISL